MKIERLRYLREKRGLSQLEAAKRMGIVRTTYSNYESGNREPDLDTLKKMADFYETTVGYLLEDEVSGLHNQEEVIDSYNKLPVEKKKIVDDIIKALLNE